MKKHIKLLSLTACLLAVTTACESTLETLPTASIDKDIALQEASGVEAFLVSTYDNLQSSGYYGRDFICVPEVLSDNMYVVSSNSNRFVNESNNQIRSQINIWNIAYNTINKANGIIKYVGNAAGMTDARKKQVQGEALFLRALAYFDLIKTYAYAPGKAPNNFDLGVPLQLEYVEAFPTDIKYPTRAKASEVYAQIKKDLEAAIGLLDNSKAPKFASKVAAQALRARAALYLGEWADAVKYATDAINAGGNGYNTFVSDPTKYWSIFTTAQSPESIFEVNFEQNESLGSDCLGSIYSRNNYPSSPSLSGAGYGDISPQANLVNLYETGDVRKDLLFSITKGSERIFWNLKYPSAKAPNVDNTKILRISEMYLIRAEANANLNNTADALTDLNRIRTRAGLKALTGLTGTALLDAVLKERRIELAYEGIRWFDLIRLNADVIKTRSATVATVNETIKATDYRLLAPIPQGELDVNKSLVQNPGY
ncbi:MAG: RagB/SusD family nutrient uptake outer membrane protein [Spirosomataceae bacterium]